MTIGINIFPQNSGGGGGGGGTSSLANFKGNYNASTNSPALANGTGHLGDWYYVSVAGTNNPTGVNIPVGHAIYYSSSNTWLDYGVTPTLVGTTLPIQNIGNNISLLYDNVTLDAGGAGTSLEVKAGGVGTTQLANTAVTTAKIANNAVTATQIANNTITATQIANNTITAIQIANNTITNANLALGIINDNNLSDTSTIICQWENDFSYPVGVSCYYQGYIWYSAQFPNLNNTPAQGSLFWYRARDTNIYNNRTITANGTLVYSDNVLIVDCTSGALTVTLSLITVLESSPNTTKTYVVRKKDNTNNVLNIALTSPNTFQGGATAPLVLKGQGATASLAVDYGSTFIFQSTL